MRGGRGGGGGDLKKINRRVALTTTDSGRLRKRITVMGILRAEREREKERERETK